MDIPEGRLDSIRQRIAEALDACGNTVPADPGKSRLGELAPAFEQLTEVMQRLDADSAVAVAPDAAEVTGIGEFALQLAEALAAELELRRLQDHRLSQAALAIDLALWVAARGGVIDRLEPVVDALAGLANSMREPDSLAALSRAFERVSAAVSPLISQDLEKFNPGRPWRVLLLNQSIVATRSHDTRLMEQAFARLTEKLPEDAARFFSAGMEQMDALDYPDHVREVMARYHRQWNPDRSMH